MKLSIEQQTELLKVIIQKMEIKTEDDDNDEPINEANKSAEMWNNGFKNVRLKNFVINQMISNKKKINSF